MTDTSSDPSAVAPEGGIEAPLAVGLSGNDAHGDAADTDLQPGGGRTDPDDTEGSIEQATAASRGQS